MAHTYATDSTERQYMPFVLAGAAFGAASLIHYVASNYLTIPWWVPSLDTLGLYGILYFLFDRFLWRWRWLNRLGITKLPDLRGEWKGQVTPAETTGISAGRAMAADMTFTIHQTWTSLAIIGQSARSESHSLSASLLVADRRRITYEYLNEPRASAGSTTMHAHRGTAQLTIDAKANLLEGEYYSGRDRQNVGTITMTRLNTPK